MCALKLKLLPGRILKRRLHRLASKAASLAEGAEQPIVVNTRYPCETCGKVKPLRLYLNGRRKLFIVETCHVQTWHASIMQPWHDWTCLNTSHTASA